MPKSLCETVPEFPLIIHKISIRVDNGSLRFSEELHHIFTLTRKHLHLETALSKWSDVHGIAQNVFLYWYKGKQQDEQIILGRLFNIHQKLPIAEAGSN